MAELKIEHLANSPHNIEPPPPIETIAPKRSPEPMNDNNKSSPTIESKDEEHQNVSHPIIKLESQTLTKIEQTCDSQSDQVIKSPETNARETQVLLDVKDVSSNNNINNNNNDNIDRNDNNNVLGILEEKHEITNININDNTNNTNNINNDNELKLDMDKSGSSNQEIKVGNLIDDIMPQPTKKESRFEELIIDGFAICAFQTWEELQDEVNEQIAIKKANESKNAVVSVAKIPRKNNKLKPKVPQNTSNDVSSNSKTVRTKRKDNGNTISKKSPSKKSKKSLESQPPTTCETTKTSSTNENLKRKKDKPLTLTNASTSQKREMATNHKEAAATNAAATASSSSKSGENKKPESKVRNTSNNTFNNASPQVHNNNNSHLSNDIYRREFDLAQKNASASSPNKTTRSIPFNSNQHINRATDHRDQQHYTGQQYMYPSHSYAQQQYQPNYNVPPPPPSQQSHQHNHHHQQSRVPHTMAPESHERNLFKPTEHNPTTVRPQQNSSHNHLTSATTPNQPAQQHPTFNYPPAPPYYPHHYPNNPTTPYPYSSFPYPYQYGQHYSKQPQQTQPPPGYAQGGSSSGYHPPAPPYQHFYPPTAPNLHNNVQYSPYSTATADPHSQQPQPLPPGHHQASATHYHPSSMSGGGGGGAGIYPTHYEPNHRAYVMTDTTISRQTSIVPTYPTPGFNPYPYAPHQPPAPTSAATTPPTNRYSSQYYSHAAVPPYDQAAAAAAAAATSTIGAKQSPSQPNQFLYAHHRSDLMEYAKSYHQSGPNHLASASYSNVMKPPPSTPLPALPPPPSQAQGVAPSSSNPTASSFTNLQPSQANPFSHINRWPGTALHHQWAAASRFSAQPGSASLNATRPLPQQPPPPPSFPGSLYPSQPPREVPPR